jgi:hypothetical protein
LDGKIQILDPEYTSRIIFPRALLKNFGLKILKFFVVDPDPGSGAFLTRDPHHWVPGKL